MIDDAAVTPSRLQSASDGRLGVQLSFSDPAFWRETTTLRAAPAYAVSAVCIAVALAGVFAGDSARGFTPSTWGLSAQALAEGRWSALLTHMITHGGLTHLLMNCGFLLGVTPVVMSRFGVGPSGWLRFAVLFLVSGLLGAALYLALHPAGVIPMVGASGAICGLWGAAARIGPDGGIVPIRSGPVWEQIKAFAKMNVILFGLIFLLMWMTGGQGGLAWEAHLGGFLFGLFAVTWLAPRTP
ncbi:rhomboid family intramembrane serine protease [Brevundimonas sp.]|uniref:rhomboid family intramembrane serine protease n=1 Tax=Brevundimonas sp. TaxID=1871086 RepID=UPI002FCA2887